MTPYYFRPSVPILFLSMAIVVSAAARLTAEQAERTKLQDQFIANASHELRTPLGIIYGYGELGQDGLLVPEMQAAAWEQVYKSAVRMRWLVENVLGAGKLEAGGNVTLTAVDLTAVVREVLDGLHETAVKGGITLAAGHLPACTITGSEQLLWLAICNLVNNAVKFTKSGGRVTVSIEEGRGMVSVIVADTGIGMSKETMAVIFEKFRQGDGSDTRRYGGTGIGLYFVKLVATFHGGTVDVESEVGKGSTFWLRLPVGSSHGG